MPSSADPSSPEAPLRFCRSGLMVDARSMLSTLIVLGSVALTPLVAKAYDALEFDAVYIQGVFSPKFSPPAPGTYDLPVIRRVPTFSLLDSAGRRVSTQAVMHGKVAVVSFIYTACSDRLGCPLASVALRELQAELLQEGLQERAVLLSISLDPERDTPAHLAKYARLFAVDPAAWHFLTAPSDRGIRPVLESYGQDRTRVYDEHGRFTGRYRHVLKVFLVDPEGYVRNIYSTGFLVPQVVVNDIKTLLIAGTAGRPGEPYHPTTIRSER